MEKKFGKFILQRDVLTIELLTKLSYESEMEINFKKNLH